MEASQTFEKHQNNFNLLRMIAAFAVVVSHAYPACYGLHAKEPLSNFLPEYSLGRLGVWTFFTVSGYFISQSFERHSAFEFVAARGLRIYPGLIVVLLVTAFIVGPIFTNDTLSEYFQSRTVYKYVLKCLTLKWMVYKLPGVFSSSPYGDAVNNPLWTLYYEVTCYALVMCVGWAVQKYRNSFIILLAFYFLFQATVVWLQNSHSGQISRELKNLHEFSFPFVMGMIFYQYRAFIKYRMPYALAAVAAIGLFHKMHHFIAIFMPLWSYLVMYAGFFQSGILQRYNKVGDYSYGVYIYGWLIEQAIVSVFSPLSPWQLVLYSTPFIAAFAIASWRFVERPSMKLKRFLFIKNTGPNQERGARVVVS
jgi:peptidoglycan/LPS O-acetylase OafA/YrhL